MPFRFYRRVKIAPGVTLNLSKGGVSISGGVRGARFTAGRTGKRTTLGIPGSGLHWTEHEGWGDSGRERGTVERSRKEGEIEVLSNEIEDQLEAYEALVDHWKDLPRIPSLQEFQAYSRKVEFKPLPPPDDPDYAAHKRELHKELTREKYQTFPYSMLPVSVSKNKAREELKDRWPDLANRMQRAYEKRLAEHEGRMSSIQASHEASEAARLESLSKILNDDPEATTDVACDVFENIDWPFETAAGIATNDGVHLYVNLDLPEIEDTIPATLPKLGRGNQISEQKRSKGDQYEDYFRLVVGQAVYLAACEFAWNPTLETVSIAAFTQRIRRNAEDDVDQYVYSMTLTQDQIRHFDPESQSLSSLLAECGAHIDRDRNGQMRQITPPEWVT